MRKVTKVTSQAFHQGRDIKMDNTSVLTEWGETTLFLHGNPIAYKDRKSGKVQICNRGWFSNTTKERLNGILEPFELKIFQKNWNWFIGGFGTRSNMDDIAWDGDLIAVN